MLKAIKIIHNPSLFYLAELEKIYKKEGYPTRLAGENNKLEIYEKGKLIPKTSDEIIIEKWID